jgi:methylated-DNA-[protein]-cysteine S-methyltransferase
MRNPRIEAQARIATPLGPMTLAATANGLAGAWFDDQSHHPGLIDAPVNGLHPHIISATAAFALYWKNQSVAPIAFQLPLDPAGTVFQLDVWRALHTIEPGMTATYSEIARLVGQPNASRAVGAALGRNPISVIVPCHRVVGRDGRLTGYAGGLARKQSLLAHERRFSSFAR